MKDTPMSKTVPPQKVTDFLAFLIEFNKNYKVNKHGTVVCQEEGEKETPVQILREGKGYNLRVFQDPVPHGTFWLLNPFAGTLRTAPDLGWFYRSLLHPLILRLLMSVQVGVMVLLKEKGEEFKKQALVSHVELDAELRELLTGSVEKKTLIDEVDARMIDELTSLMGHKAVAHRFIQLVYSAANISCHPVIAPFKSGEGWYEEETGIKVRKKTIRVIDRLVRNYLGLEKDQEVEKVFVTPAGEYESPRLSAWLRCYTRLCVQLDPVFERLVPGSAGDVEALQNWLEYLPAMSARAKLITGGFHESVQVDEVKPIMQRVEDDKDTPAERPKKPTISLRGPALAPAPRRDDRDEPRPAFRRDREEGPRLPSFGGQTTRRSVTLFRNDGGRDRDRDDRGRSSWNDRGRSEGPRLPSFRR